MSYRNKIGQEIAVGDIVTHTTASQYASLDIGVVRGFGPSRYWDMEDDEHVQVKVIWVREIRYGRDKGKTKLVKTAVALPTVTRVDLHTISPELQKRLREAQSEVFTA